MERMTIELHKRLERSNLPSNSRGLRAMLSGYKLELYPDPLDKGRGGEAVKATEFCAMLEKMGVIQSTKESGIRPLLDEYGIPGEEPKNSGRDEKSRSPSPRKDKAGDKKDQSDPEEEAKEGVTKSIDFKKA